MSAGATAGDGAATAADAARTTCGELLAIAREDPARAAALWLAADPDGATRERLQRILRDRDALRARMADRLAFGTAGLRAPLGAGPTRMNRLVVRQTTAGLVRWLTDRLGRAPRVAVGHDARHGSASFARDAAGVIAAAGGTALLLPPRVPTPYLAFATRHLDADAGVQVTASHNPPADNGYKVYLGDGAQLPPPLDREIAAAIDAGPLAPACVDGRHDAVEPVGDRVRDGYHDWLRTLVAELLGGLPDDDATPPRVVHTALHGVGTTALLAAFETLGLPRPTLVEEQAAPDPDFPTVVFPNPEEPGALDLALATAARVDADLVLANDPDADRLAVAVRPAPGAPASRLLTGNELGVLLADHVLRHTAGDDRLVATTVVSSGQLARLAAHHGVRAAETLTGFKWIVRPGIEDESSRFVFGYEEAIGYAIGDGVRDKDGISAAVALVVAATEQAGRDRTLLDRLDEIATTTGLHVTDLLSRRFDGAEADARRDEIMARVRASPPEQVAGRTLVEGDDLALGGRLPATDAVVLRYAPPGGDRDDADLRVVVRPSGTEPKIKCYLELHGAPGPDAAAERARLDDALAAAVAAFGTWLDDAGP